MLGGWNLWRALLLIRRRAFLTALEVSVDPLARAVIALFWTLVFLVAAIAILQRNSRLRWLLPAGLLLYMVIHFGLIFFSPSPLAWQGWGASLIAYLVAALAAIWALYRPATRLYWRRPSLSTGYIDRERGEVVT